MSDTKDHNKWSPKFRCSSFYAMSAIIGNLFSKFGAADGDTKEADIEIMVSKIYYDTYTLHFAYGDMENVPRICPVLKKDPENKKIIEEFKKKIERVKELYENHKYWKNWKDNCVSVKEILETPSEHELPEELLRFFTKIPSPILWYEEGIAYRLLQDSNTSQLFKIFFSMQGVPEGGNTRETEINWRDDGLEKDKNGEPVLPREGEPRGECPEKVELEDQCIVKATKNLFSILLGTLGKNSEEIKKLTVEDALKGEADYSRKHSFIVPIWQNYINGSGYGGVCGFLNIYIGNLDPSPYIDRMKDIISRSNRILGQLIGLSNEFYLSSSAYMRNRLDQMLFETRHPSIIELLLKSLPYIQDWKTIWIVDKDNQIIQCWGREDKGFARPWQEKTTEKGNRLKLCERKFPGYFEFEFDDLLFGKNKDAIKSLFKDAERIIFEPPEVFSDPRKNGPKNREDIPIFENRLLDQCHELVNMIYDKLKQYEYTERLASSTIMARNMSHNIGSHVLVSVMSELSSGDKKKWQELALWLGEDGVRKTQILVNLSELNEEQIQRLAECLMEDNACIRNSRISRRLKEWLGEEKGDQVSDKLQKSADEERQQLAALLNDDKETKQTLAKLLGYLQMRMDHLAEVATWRGHDERPTSLYLDSIENDFKNQELLRRYISGVNIKNKKEPLGCSGEFRAWDKKTKKYGAIEGMCTAVPNGSTGIHAFYIIIENFVRNIAKHNEISVDVTSIGFHVDINDEFNPDKYPDMIEVLLWQESVAERKEPNLGGCRWFALLWQKSAKDKDKVKKINGLIKESLIQQDFQPRGGAWGIGEMVLSAQYLRQDHYTELPTLKAFWANKEGKLWVDEEDKKTKSKSDYAHILYRFYMQKPKEVAIVVKKDDEIPETNIQKTMRNSGIEWVSLGDKQDMEKIINYVKNYRRVVWLAEEAPDRSNDLDLPLRTFVTSKVKGYESVTKDDFLKEVQGCFKANLNLYSFLGYLDKKWCDFLSDDRHGKKSDEIQLLNNQKSPLGKSWDNPQLDNDTKTKILYNRHSIEAKLLPHVKDNGNWFFVEVYRSQSNLQPTWERPLQSKEYQELLKYEFISAAMAKIVVLDERVQDDVDEYRTIHEPKNEEEWAKWILAQGKNRIFVPRETDCSLDPEPDWESIKEYLKDIHQKEDPIDCIVIHLGILQKLAERNKKKESHFLYALKGIGEDAPYPTQEVSPLSVRICTGRGNVHDHIDGSDGEIIPISELQKWLNPSGPSKYHLYRLLDL